MKPLKILWGVLLGIFLALGGGLYLYDQRTRVMAEFSVDRWSTVRISEISPEGRWFSDYFVYRFEYLRDGRLVSCASFSGDSFKATRAKISAGKDGIISATLNDEAIYAIDLHDGLWRR